MTRAHSHTHSSAHTGQGPSAGTNHLLKLLWRSWQSARGRHDFGSHSCPHQQSKMFLGVDPWQPLLLQSSFITVKFYKRENKPFFLHFNRLSIQSKQQLREFICFWRHVLNGGEGALSSYLYTATATPQLYNIMENCNLKIDLIQNTLCNYCWIPNVWCPLSPIPKQTNKQTGKRPLPEVLTNSNSSVQGIERPQR